VHTCLLAGLLLAAGTPVVAAVTGSPLLPAPSPAQVTAVGYLVVVVTAVAFVAWYTCVSRLGAERAGLLVGLMPVSALAASLALGQTTITAGAGLGVALVGMGVAVGLTAGQPRPRTTDAAGHTARAGQAPPAAGRAAVPDGALAG
jgi:drug/metabolite transporter (DMT)-like permease